MYSCRQNPPLFDLAENRSVPDCLTQVLFSKISALRISRYSERKPLCYCSTAPLATKKIRDSEFHPLLCISPERCYFFFSTRAIPFLQSSVHAGNHTLTSSPASSALP